ncbi:MAG: response regulator [Desulfobacterales bacterium]|nr:MAG: response regulator [Desulfobacterales bacterium]
MSILRRLSIKHKLILITLLTCCLGLLLTAAVTIGGELIFFRKGMIQHLSALAQVVGIYSTRALALQDRDTAQEILSALRAEPNVRAASIYTGGGNLLATYRAHRQPRLDSLDTDSAESDRGEDLPLDGRPPERPRFAAGYLDLVTPIMLDGKPLGKIYIRADLDGFYPRRGRFIILAIGCMLGFLFLVFLMATKLQRMISEPILTLARTVETVSRQKDYTVRAVKQNDDELGVLIDGFNDMLRQIQEREEALKGHRQKLEEQVRLRTAELEVNEKQKRALLFQQKIQKAYGDLVGLLNTIDISRILERSLNRIVSQIKTSWGAFYLCQEDNDELALKKFYAPNSNFAEANRRKVLLSRALEFARQVFVKQEKLVIHWQPSARSGNNSAAIVTGYPLRFQNKPLGVLVLARDRQFSIWTQSFLDNVARQLGVAIHNALTLQTLRFRSAELRQKNEELAKASQMKSEFLANMSHELRTPLNAVIGFSEVLADKHFGELNATQEEYLNDIITSGKHLLALINDILDLSKVEAGKMELDLTNIELKPLLSGSLTMVKEKAVKRGIELSLDAYGRPDTIWADERKVKQIVFNLLSNAVKFTPDGGKIDVHAEVVNREWLQNNVPALFRDELLMALEYPHCSYLKIAVTDTGIGIRTQSLKRVFEVFQQENSSTSRQYGGTGLGLALCKSILELHHGAIWVESQLGKGSTFSFILPLIEHTDVRDADPGHTRTFVRTLLTRERPLVMVVDDDEKISRQLARILRREGCAVQIVMDGQNAVKKAGENLPDLILLDLMLPSKDGWEVLTRLKTDTKTRDIPIIICSAIEDRKSASALGAFDYLVKPVLKEDLLRCLNKAGIRSRGRSHAPAVLLVDDDPQDRKYYTQILEGEGFTVRVAENGREAISVSQKEAPALVLQDLMLPDMSGYEVISALKADPATQNIPVVVLTAQSLGPAERTKLAVDIESIVNKSPEGKKQLLAEVNRFLAHYQRPDGIKRRPSAES